MGIVVNDGTSAGSAQVDATVAAVVTGEDGRIVSCYLDVAQTKIGMDGGILDDAASVDVRSKQEKGDDYGMVAYGSAIAEWYEQADYFAEQVVGMTADEVTAIASDDETILAGCTMGFTDFQEAIAKACSDEYAKEFSADSFKLGLGVVTEVDSSSASASDDADGSANLYSHFAAVVTDDSGVILVDLIDAVQPKITFDTTGEEIGFAFTDTKKYLKDDYGMVAYANSVGEWYEETGAFEDYIVGMDAAGVTGIATETNEEGNAVATDADADLVASCTIAINSFQEAVAKACSNAR
jgi:hypothetical protein